MYFRRMSNKRIVERVRERAVRRFKRKIIMLKRLDADVQAINRRLVALMTGVDLRAVRSYDPKTDETILHGKL